MLTALRLLILVVLLGAGAWWLTNGRGVDPSAYATLTGDAAHGETVFWAAGCASCHAAPEASGEAKLVLAGGQRFPSDFGTFVAPNISPDKTHGIGNWSLEDFASAVTRGVSPQGEQYYPAFPYATYIRMTDQDVADLYAYMMTLPGSDRADTPHELAFPFSIRRSVAVWKWLFLDPDWVMPADNDELDRGRYLVEALAHCAECHTPRNLMGGLELDRWMGGAPNPSGQGRIPNITPAALDWSAGDIAYYLETGFTPDFDSVGGHMASVVDNFGHLSAEDRAAVAAYVTALPPVTDPSSDDS